MSKMAAFIDNLRFKLGLDIRDPKAVFPDPMRRLEFLKSRTAGEKHFSVASELYDIADQYPDLTTPAVAVLAKCMFDFDGRSMRWSKEPADLLVKLGPRATAAIPHLETVLSLQPPAGYDPNERTINVSLDQSVGHMIRTAQKEARLVLKAIQTSGAEEQKTRGGAR